MKFLFCISDIHSFYEKMILALNEAGFDINNENHILVHCGDLLDRGPDAKKCLKFINSIPDNRKILIRGNHEDLLEEAYGRGMFLWHDVHNGTIDTVSQLSGISYNDVIGSDLTAFAALDKCMNSKDLKKYYNSLIDYKEVGDYIFVHGWFPTMYEKNGMPIYNWKDGYWKEGDWKNARWSNGMEKWSEGYILSNKIIVCGHYHTSWGHYNLHGYGVEFDDEYYENADPDQRAHFEPFIDKGIIAIDSCIAYSDESYCYKIEIGDDIWQGSM